MRPNRTAGGGARQPLERLRIRHTNRGAAMVLNFDAESRVDEVLTISGHADSQTLLEATLLTAVPVDPHDGAVLHLKTLLVLDVLLNAPPEEALRKPQIRLITRFAVTVS